MPGLNRFPAAQDWLGKQTDLMRPEAMIKEAVCAGLMLLLASARAEAQGLRGAGAASNAAADTWIFSETQSPLDYAPVTIASAWSNADAEGRAMQLSIQCRRGRTDLVILSPALTDRVEQARVSYAVDRGAAHPARLQSRARRHRHRHQGRRCAAADQPAARAARSRSMSPNRRASPLDGHYALPAFSTVLNRLAAPCKWSLRNP